MNDTPLPGQDLQSEETICPSCGRFVGALTRCPHCGSRINKRLSIRVFRYGALLLGIVGLGLLYLMVTHREIPMIQIGDIRPTMNFAYVRVAGEVSSDARAYKEGGRVRSLRFMVDDGTGEISITAYRSQAQQIVDEGKMPRLGDLVEVAGSLSISAEDDPIMRLQVPDQLTIMKADMPTALIGDLTEDTSGSVQVQGVITEVMAPRAGSKAPWVVVIDDGSGQGPLTFWDSIYAEIPQKVLLMEGATVKARVNVKTYKDRLQLSVEHGSDIEFIDAGAIKDKPKREGKKQRGEGKKQKDRSQAKNRTPLEVIAIANLSADQKGKRFRVTGTVTELIEPEEGSKSPYRMKLKDGDSEVVVVYWDKVAKRLGDSAPDVGASVAVEGLVDEYRGQVQLKVNNSKQIQVEGQ